MITDIILTIVTMAFALVVVFSKKTVISALSLLMTLVCIALIYFQLGTYFLAAVQILINAGAVAILFVFVMMLINLDDFQNNRETNKLKIGLSVFVSVVIFAVVGLVFNSNIELLSTNNIADNSMYLIFDKLFADYYLPFEMASVLLLAAMVACVLITGEARHVLEEEENEHE